jgi:hypothetical protein
VWNLCSGVFDKTLLTVCNQRKEFETLVVGEGRLLVVLWTSRYIVIAYSIAIGG